MKKTILAALLVAGTCIGGGALALPVLTADAGFVPSIAVFVISWFVMAATGLLYFEATLWMGGDTNIISMASATLGAPGRAFAWILYLFLFYCLTVAYMVGCGNLVELALNNAIPDWSGPIVFTLIFAPFIFLGARAVGWLNALFVAGLGVSYLLFMVSGFGHVDTDLLERASWSKVFKAFPIALLSFGFQGIVPTLARYLDFDKKKGVRAIVLGSFIPVIAYGIWQVLMLGIFSKEALVDAQSRGLSPVLMLEDVLDNPFLITVGAWFAFFALTTSFFGVTLGLRDFLADGLGIEKNNRGKLILCLLIFVLPMIIAASYPTIFVEALQMAGLWGGTLLLGILPILIVWMGRYVLKMPGERLLRGGKTTLALLMLVLLAVLIYHPN